MKRFTLFCIIATFTLTAASAQPKQVVEASKSDGRVLKSVIKVPTIVCGSCVTTITEALKKVDGVKSAKVDLKKKTATVSFAAIKVTVEMLEKAIADAGYDANRVKRNPEAFEKLEACCKADPKN